MVNYFERLGLEPRFTLDLAEVERCYFERSRMLHPDFHHNNSSGEQRASLELTAALNEAYVALKDPFRRAEHMLMLAGGPTAGEEKNLDQFFLMEMMEIRERIDAAREAGSGLDAIEAELTERLTYLLATAGGAFDTGSTLEKKQLIAIRRNLNSAKTLKSLLREIQDT